MGAILTIGAFVASAQIIALIYSSQGKELPAFLSWFCSILGSVSLYFIIQNI